MSHITLLVSALAAAWHATMALPDDGTPWTGRHRAHLIAALAFAAVALTTMS